MDKNIQSSSNQPFIELGAAKYRAFEHVLNTRYRNGGYADTHGFPSQWNSIENRWEISLCGYLDNNVVLYLVYVMPDGERIATSRSATTEEIAIIQKNQENY